MRRDLSPSAVMNPKQAQAFRNECIRFSRDFPQSKSRAHDPLTGIMLRFGQGKCSLDEALLELFYGSVPMAKLSELAGKIWGRESWFSSLSSEIESIRQASSEQFEQTVPGKYPRVFIQALHFPLGEETTTAERPIVCIVGERRGGRRDLLGIECLDTESNGWVPLFRGLKSRGLVSPLLFVGENAPAAFRAMRGVFPESRYQGCLNQLREDIMSTAPVSLAWVIKEKFSAMRSCRDKDSAMDHGLDLVSELKAAAAPEASRLLEEALPFIFNYHALARSQGTRLCDALFLKKQMRSTRERVRTLRSNPDLGGLLLLLAARVNDALALWNAGSPSLESEDKTAEPSVRPGSAGVKRSRKRTLIPAG